MTVRLQALGTIDFQSLGWRGWLVLCWSEEALTCAVDAEHLVARLAEHQLLLRVQRALGDDVTPLARHQVEQLVD